MTVSVSKIETAPKEITGDRNTILPEVDVYFRLLVTLFMLDNEKIDEANDVASGALAIVRDKKYARQRSLEPLSWRIERYIFFLLLSTIYLFLK